MIRGLDAFREHFADYRKAFVLIGGVACHEWLSMQGLEFRATKDMDMVLIVEVLDAEIVSPLMNSAGIRQRVRLIHGKRCSARRHDIGAAGFPLNSGERRQLGNVCD
jgi:hypothetical protein